MAEDSESLIYFSTHRIVKAKGKVEFHEVKKGNLNKKDFEKQVSSSSYIPSTSICGLKLHVYIRGLTITIIHFDLVWPPLCGLVY